MKEKIIIDTDPGIDDAMAIFFASQSPKLDLIGLTTVFGNVPVEMSTDNAIRLCDILKKDIPVCQGAAKPYGGDVEPQFAHFVHGDNGLGNIELPAPSREADSRSAAEFIVEMAKKHPGEVTLVAVGPLTNVAHALDLEPELPKLLKRVVVMGGAAKVRGNVSPVAEANIWNDPYGAEVVFATEYANPLVLIGLDVTYAVSFNVEFNDKLESVNPTIGSFMNKAAKFYTKFYSEVFQNSEEKVCYFHDALAIAHIIEPDIFQYQDGHLRVSKDELCYGQTSFEEADNPMPNPAWASQPIISAALEVNGDKVRDLIHQAYAL